MIIREPAMAGRFYADTSQACLADAKQCFPDEAPHFPSRVYGGLVPHAGWMYSGPVAGLVFSALAGQKNLETVVLLGAVHHVMGERAALFPRGAWETPIGPVRIDEHLADRVLALTNLVEDDPAQHESEHSIEVQVPLIRHALPDVKILPIMVPPSPRAVRIGAAVGRAILDARRNAVVVASSDLTHYGPRFRFTPQGVGPQAIRWAHDVNDRAILDRIERLEADGIVPEARRNRNACGSGAIAAAVAAATQIGAIRALILAHTNSQEILPDAQATDSVGYAGGVFL